MRGKKVVNNNQILQNTNIKPDQNRLHLKRKLNDVKSLEPRPKAHLIAPQSQKMIKLPLQNAVNDYEFERRERQTQQINIRKDQNNPIFTVQAVP